MFAIITNIEVIQAQSTVLIEFEESDLELALVVWLNQILGKARELGMVFGHFQMTRQALLRWNGKEIIQQLAHKGTLVRSCSMRGVAEEALDAYKDVNLVAEATEQADLARRIAFLKPKICIKG